ncbi:nicotinamide riboside transporter PnuC [Mucilaginibacter conchicola]|uniref:Nicotinamide riboside transporter PnuC n=1 Tax=Mucilaginibacter conchicola TaxID=2303333 RepID=A0A372NU18_9SPHI|nr:nicotinamide riboside transporter PnuC [Mucilaginibacter conchicola]RFZ92484.1 nicotinamide riboside transporter PnuC [Mucilaginibacter conchicola]
MHFFDIGHIAFTIMGYPVSFVELIGTLFGLISVWFASRANILTWGTGIVNEVFLFILFFQVQLYADMFLQVYFFVVTIYGWYNWKAKPDAGSITVLNSKQRWLTGIVILASSVIAGFLIQNIHRYLPQYFKIQAAYPYTDSFVMVLSIVAIVLLAMKKIENWVLWILTDAICVVLYIKKGVYFLSLEYFIFFGLASYGLYQWKKQMAHG